MLERLVAALLVGERAAFFSGSVSCWDQHVLPKGARALRHQTAASHLLQR
jgi:hypothetical protein